jgi:hypothetical protein
LSVLAERRMNPSAIWDAMAGALPPMKFAMGAAIIPAARGLDD